MQQSLKNVLIIVMVIYLFFIAKSVKRKNMRIGYLVFWIITGVILTIAILIPNFVENISKLTGFEVPINMLFSVSIFIMLYLIHDLIILISKESQKNVTLIQEVSMLKERIEEIEKKSKKEE